MIFVLHRPSSAENIGAVARVLANFEIPRMRVVAPPSWSGVPRSGGGQNAKEDVFRRAQRTARRARPILDAAEVFPVDFTGVRASSIVRDFLKLQADQGL